MNPLDASVGLPGSASVRLQGLSKSFPGAIKALDRVSLDIGAGEFFALLGPSGCGKTTTLRLVAGFETPDQGRVVVGGQDVTEMPVHRRDMGVIFQSYALFPHRTVAENVAFGLRMRRIPRQEIDRRVSTALAQVALTGLEGRRPAQLSGGQQQRVALARALIVEPETLLLDEPLSNLDANLREEMRFEIRRLHDQYRYTTVYVTHDQSEAMTTADLIAVMNAGKIDQLGTPEDIYDRPQSEFVARFIGASNVIKGTAKDENHVAFAGTTLRVVGAKLGAGQVAPVAIRQHDIQLSTQAPQNPQNALKARVTRQVFLGASRDYLVATKDGTTLRVDTAPDNLVPEGAEVWLTLPPERCRALER